MVSKYGVIHITTGGELFTPLVASQLFDQAEALSVSKNSDKPFKVAAWALESMRVAMGIKGRNKVIELKKRCPDVDIRCIGGINRINDWPQFKNLIRLRKRIFGSNPVIYHCRGESSIPIINKMKEHFPNDKIHLDIRGHWSSESLYQQGIELANITEYIDGYFPTHNDECLLDAIKMSDSISTVSDNLKLLIKTYYKAASVYVIPCCVSTICNGKSRNEIRLRLGVNQNEKLIVYSGGIAPYQHLEDLIIPLTRQLLECQDIKILFLSHQKLEIEGMLLKQNISSDKINVISAPQIEVLNYLSAGDAGLMIRKPSLVNKVANPVKIAEYLAAGVPVILQKGIGGISKNLEEYNAGLVIDLFSKKSSFKSISIQIENWLSQKQNSFRQNSLLLASEEYTWPKNVDKHIRNYYSLLSK
jgi:glycosyltransferase involved in cell wall biosynthesis